MFIHSMAYLLGDLLLASGTEQYFKEKRLWQKKLKRNL